MSAEPALNIDFEVGMYRPPSEGGSHSLLIRVTRNCPWNRCEFCAVGNIYQRHHHCRSVAELTAKTDDARHRAEALAAEIEARAGSLALKREQAAAAAGDEPTPRILGAALSDSRAYAKLAYLSDRIGHHTAQLHRVLRRELRLDPRAEAEAA